METFFVSFLAAIAFGTLWGWIIFAAALVLIIACVDNDRGFPAFFTLLFATVFLFSLHLKHAVMYITTHPVNTLIGIGLYFVAGTVWGVTKWFLYVTKKLEEYKEKRAEFLRKNSATEVTPDLVRKFKDYMYLYDDKSPQVHSHKSDILMWMTYWPFSSVWTLLNDPLRRAFRAIYRSISSMLQSMSDRLFKDVVAEMNQPLPPPPADALVSTSDLKGKPTARRSNGISTSF